MNDLTIFTYKDCNVRIIDLGNDEIGFIAIDVAKIQSQQVLNEDWIVRYEGVNTEEFMCKLS